MTKPAVAYLLAWSALATIWFAHLWADNGAGGGTRNDGLYLVGAAAAIWVFVGAASWVAWIILLAVWEGLVWFVRTDAQLATNRVGRWLSIEECRANKQQLEIGLRNFAPNLAMSGLLAVAGDGGGLLGGDLATVYLCYAQPWLNWNQAENQLMAGQAVWLDNPPPADQTLMVVAPYIRLGIGTAIVAAWIGCLADLPGHDPATITILLVVAVIVARRHRIRAAILARR